MKHSLAIAGDGKPQDRKLFVIAFRCGRLANRLILFANFIALAKEQGDRLINFSFHSYADLFESTSRDIYCSYPSPARRSWMDLVPVAGNAIRKSRILYHVTRAAARLNGRFPLAGGAAVTLRERPGQGVLVLDSPEFQAELSRAKVVFVYGWNFRAADSVRRHAQEIRTYFRPVEKYATAARKAVADLRQHADLVMGVHIRQGDYRRWRGGKYYFPVTRYADWMRELAAQFPARKVSFLVCSDERRSAEEFAGLSVGFGPDCPVSDLYALAECDYVLGPPSTFSQWASFYGGKPLLHLYDSNARMEIEKFHVSDLGNIPG